jgi:hypothetical protein
VILINAWDQNTIVSTTLVQNNQQKNVSKPGAQKTFDQYCGGGWNEKYLRV